MPPKQDHHMVDSADNQNSESALVTSEFFNDSNPKNKKNLTKKNVLPNRVSRVPYVHLISHPTWNSRTFSWTLSGDLPRSIIHASGQTRGSERKVKTQFRTKVLVNDDCIKVEGEGVVGLSKGTSERICSINRYD
ncbi:hypothetical protein AgCh_027023 [Apium graveolens]